MLVVCEIMGWISDGTSEHEEWFEGDKLNKYKEGLLGIAEFPFLLSLHILLNSKASYNFQTA